MINTNANTNTKPKLALCMIVKDEAHVIKETLECVSKYIDYYVINDTGSTDNTKEVIKEYFDEKGIPGEIVTHEFRSCTCHGPKYKKWSWFHFGWNRSYAMKLCEGKSQYIWVMDADDLVAGNLVIPELTKDSYDITFGKGFTYKRTQFFKNDASLNWHYKNPRHEYPTCDKKNRTKGTIDGDYYIESRRLGARSNNPNKYLEDAKVFEDKLKKNPNNERYAFYCAQSYFDHGDYNSATKWYKKRIELGGWYEEVFYSYYRTAIITEKLGMPWIDTEKAYLAAYNFCKIRAEPLYNIACHYRSIGNYQTGYNYAKKALQIPYPEKCVLFMFKDVYDYKSALEVSLNAYHLGKYDEACSLAKKILLSKSISSNDLQLVRNHIILCTTKLTNKNKKLCCVYIGNEFLNKESKLLKLLEHINKTYKTIIVGDKINIYEMDNIIVMNVNNFRSFETVKSFKLDYLVLYNSLNYYYDNIKIIADNVVLLQNDNVLKLTANNGIKIGVYNPIYLNTIFDKLNINKIICTDKKNKNRLMSDYKLNDVSDFDYLDENDLYKLFDNSKNKYLFKSTNENETNSIHYYEPECIKFVANNKHEYFFSNKLLIDFYRDVSKQFPTIPEHLHKLALVCIELNEYNSALNYIDSVLNLIKNNNAYKDSVLITKAKILAKSEKYSDSYNMADDVLKRDLIHESMRNEAENTRDQNIKYIKDTLLFCNTNKIKNLSKNKKLIQNAKIMFSITTGNKFDLFEKTMNSFLNCCTDFEKIDYWLCVDDNSSQEDRNKMKKTYPFFNFIWKTEQEMGYCNSMNIIQKHATTNNVEYLLHLDGEWHFVQKRNYITDTIKILGENMKLGQVLFNNHYGDIEPYHKRCKGGILQKTKDGMRYYVHEYYKTDTKEYKDYVVRNKGFNINGDWPNFSLNPSVLRTSVLKDVGIFYNAGDFEMQYAMEYTIRGYKSAFFDSFCSIHIGDKIMKYDKNNKSNSNNTEQAVITNGLISINVVSDEKNPELWKDFKENATDKLPLCTKHTHKNITELSEYEKKIFEKNNFNYLRSIINNVMTYLNILKQNKNKYVLLLKEHVVLNNDFNSTLTQLVNIIGSVNYDFILFDTIDNNNSTSTSTLQILEKQFSINLESFNGYLVSELAIKKILAYIELNGIKNTNYLEGLTNLTTYILNKPIYTINKKYQKNTNNDDNFVKLEGYTFYSQLDSFGGDIAYFGKKNVEEYRDICEKENGICFNTLGYIKNQITPEKEFIYLPKSTKSCEGMYVKN